MATYTLTIKDSATEKVLAMFSEFSDVVEVNPLETTKAEKNKVHNSTERVENPFNYDLERMKKCVEDEGYIAIPKLDSKEELSNWLQKNLG